MKIGYARVSTITQNLDSQIDALKKAGCGKIITEQASGSVANRAELLKAKEHTLRSGDTFVVWRLDRLGRSLKDLISWTEWFAASVLNYPCNAQRRFQYYKVDQYRYILLSQESVINFV